jgi:hypothetical protein
VQTTKRFHDIESGRVHGSQVFLTWLIRAATGFAAKLRFPSDESVQFSGWDGVCEIEQGTEQIPSGRSGWEISTQREGIRGKADMDYSKRTADPLELDPQESTFVFVTPRRWSQKGDWLKRRQSERKWADVRAYDADDLVHWLELYPAVGHRLAVAIRQRPAGLRQLDEVWDEWSLSTEYPLSTDLTLAGRDEQAMRVLRWLRGEPSVFTVQGESPDEAIAFLHASIQQLPTDYRLHYQAKCLVASTPEAARALSDSVSPLILVLDSPDAGAAQLLAQRGHHVYVAYGSDAGAPKDILLLSRPPRVEIKDALGKMGIKESRAEALARDSARSLAILRRLMPSAPSRTPRWVEGAHSRALLAVLLAGAWDETFEKDKLALEGIAGQKYEAIASALAPWTGALDSPIRKAGTTWKIASPRDAWFTLARYMTDADCERFATVFSEVFESSDPRFEMQPDERWLAATKGVRPKYSELLRRGLGETLILLSLFGDKAPSVTNPAGRVQYIVRKLFRDADSRRWWSLSGDFQLLAEADPRSFLAALDDSLGLEHSPITALFGKDGGPFGTDHISHLVWALELLAWSPLYLGRVANVLAKLASLYPNGRSDNRPARSLRQIFLLWLPQTYASLEDRLRVLDRLLRTEPEVAWQLMLDIFPKGYDVSGPSAYARWRDLSGKPAEEVTYAVIARGAEELTQRLVEHVGLNVTRWNQLIEILPSLDHDRRSFVIRRLSDSASKIDNEGRSILWALLRELLHRHRELSDADWALSTGELDSLEKIYLTLEPSDAIEKHAWLFGPNVALPRPTRKDPENSQEFEKALRADVAEVGKRRRQAVIDLLADHGIDSIFALANTARFPGLVGAALAELSGRDVEKAAILTSALNGSGPANENLAHGMIAASYGRFGEPWAKTLLERALSERWGKEVTFRILRSLPETMWTWQQAAAAGIEVESRYWNQRSVGHFDGEGSDLAFAINKLIGIGRARHAIHLIGDLKAKELPDSLLKKLLTQAATEPHTSADDQLFRYYVVEIFKRLDKAGNIPDLEMAKLEWAFLPIFRFSERQVIALCKALSTTPEFFVQVLSALYRPGTESGIVEPPPSDPEHARAIATQAFTLLRSWRRIPGTLDDGTIDIAILENWIKETRLLCAQAGRTQVGDHQIGQLLAAAPSDPDGIWPIVAVRDVIEIARSRDLENGLIIGVHNNRGVTSRGVFDGGLQERELAQKYRKCAEATSLEWPRTSAVLEALSRDYEKQGRWEDDDAQRFEW